MTQNSAPPQDSFVGDIRYSILEPGTFTRLHPEWVLLAGQVLDTKSTLGSMGITQLPDARGMFLRGMNENRDPNQGDADGNRAVGNYQPDQFHSHNHGGGNHGHPWQGASTIDTWGGNVVVGGNGIGQKSTPPSGAIINTEGGNETRPRNISVYIYIKIN